VDFWYGGASEDSGKNQAAAILRCSTICHRRHPEVQGNVRIQAYKINAACWVNLRVRIAAPSRTVAARKSTGSPRRLAPQDDVLENADPP
jgi:hypothetical protein